MIIKSLLLNKEIAINDQLNINDKISFEPNNSGMIPGEYTLEFKPIIKEPDDETADYIEYYKLITSLIIYHKNKTQF